MTVEEINERIKQPDYNFLRDGSVKHDIALLALGGSHAYGIETPTSDLDIRGIALQNIDELLGLRNFENYTNKATDTTIYGINKAVKLLMTSNINMLEMLGCEPEHYITLSEAGKSLLERRDIFLSKDVSHSIMGHVNQIRHRYLRDDTPSERCQKSAAHAVRILLMGVEIHQQGVVRTYRPEVERTVLRAIRTGDIKLETARNMIDKLEELYKDAESNSVLPDHVDVEQVNRFLIDVNRGCVK